MLTHDGVIRWRDWLIENIPEDVLSEKPKAALCNATPNKVMLRLVQNYYGGSAGAMSKVFGPLQCLKNIRSVAIHQLEVDITTYLDRWYGDWIAVFEEVANDVDE